MVNIINPWQLLRSGKIQEGLQSIREAYAISRTPSHIMQLGVALLWIEEYQDAFDHFLSAIEDYPRSTSDFYGMAGVAKWCLAEQREAIIHWQEGLKAEFADTAGLGLRLPLLLLVASILHPKLLSKDRWENLLHERCKDARIRIWPGPLVKWVLRQIDDEEFQGECKGSDSVDTHDREWLTNFYRALLHYDADCNTSFRTHMQELVDTTRPEWLDDDFFLLRMWGEEFFLARYEAKSPKE